MNNSYWQQKALNERRSKLLDETRKGSQNAAEKLLSASLEALAKAISGNQLTEAHKATLDFLRSGLHDHLINGIELKRALGLENESGGRPKISEVEKLRIFALVHDEINRLRAASVSNPTKVAQKNIASKEGISERKVRDIWQSEPDKRLNRKEK